MFAYTGSDRQGKSSIGEIEAAGLVEAAERLRASGVEVVSMFPVASVPPRPAFGDADAFSFFNASLAELTRTGVPLPLALAAVAAEVERGALREAVGRVERGVREGKSLEAAMEGEREFPPEYRAMVRAGIAAGNLPWVLGAAAAHAATVRALVRAALSALTYPIIALFTGIGMIGVLSALTVPLYRDLYRQLDVPVPVVLSIFEAWTSSIVRPLSLVALVLGGLFACIVWMRRSSSGERAAWRLPFAGRVLTRLAVLRLTSTLRILIEAGTPMVTALPAAAVASGCLRWARAAGDVARLLSDGRPLEEALKALEDLPAAIARRLVHAERTQNLAGQLGWSMEDARAAAERAIADVSWFVEPAAIVIVGVMLGALFISLVAPYFLWLARMMG